MKTFIFRWIFLAEIILLFLLPAAQAEGPVPCSVNTPTPIHNPKAVEHGPQEPDAIAKPILVVPLGCERPFTYRGQTYSVDTPQAQDASALKGVIQSVPEANKLLEQYQNNRNKSKISAYTGTAGILIFAFSNLIALNFEPKDRPSAKKALQIGGASIAAGGFIFSFALLRTNELLIPKAVDQYNQAKPNDPVELKFSASWGF